MRATLVAAAGFALPALGAATAADAAPAAPPEQRVFASAPAALQPIKAPPAVDRPMRWHHLRTTAARYSGGTQRATVGLNSPADAVGVLRDYDVRGIFLDRTLHAMQIEGSAERLRTLARRVRDDVRLRYVQALKRSTFMHRRNDWALNTTDSATGVPYEWTFAHVGLDKAFNLGTGSPLIVVGVVDSGADAVPDLKGKVVQTLSTSEPTGDPVGHGTFVSSLIAANNDDGIGLAGFCGACRLLVFKLDEPDDYSIATGIRRLVDEHVRIINLSIGGYDYSAVLADAVSYAASQGVLVVAAGGNDGVPEVTYPAALLQAENGQPGTGLSVGASGGDGSRASFSNYGSRLSLLAPGTLAEVCGSGILGAVPGTPSAFDDGCRQPFTDTTTGARYAYAEGTSFAAPEVAGIAALVWAAKPSLTSAQVMSILTKSATRPAGTAWTPESGWGVVNAARALELVTGRSSADRVVVGRLTSPQAPSAGRLFQVTAPARWSDGVKVPSGKVACNVSVAARLISVRGQLGDGVALCQWRVPRLSATAPMQVIASVSDPEGVTGTSRRTFLVKGVRRRA